MKRITLITIIAVAAVLLSAGAVVYANSSKKNIVLPPKSTVEGLTYGDWLAKWWQFALELPEDQNPIVGGNGDACAIQKIGNVALVLANSSADGPTTCQVPPGTMLFVEVLGAECSNLEEAPFYGGNETDLRTCAQSLVPQDLEASIDGTSIQNLSSFYVVSPLYSFSNPAGNILGVPEGTSGESIGSGVYLLIAPLGKGEHEIHLHGYYPSLDYAADKTIKLTISN